MSTHDYVAKWCSLRWTVFPLAQTIWKSADVKRCRLEAVLLENILAIRLSIRHCSALLLSFYVMLHQHVWLAFLSASSVLLLVYLLKLLCGQSNNFECSNDACYRLAYICTITDRLGLTEWFWFL